MCNTVKKRLYTIQKQLKVQGVTELASPSPLQNSDTEFLVHPLVDGVGSSSVVFLGSPLLLKGAKPGGGNPKMVQIPDFGPFALEIWPKNTTKFPAAFGGQKGAKQGGEPKEYH